MGTTGDPVTGRPAGRTGEPLHRLEPVSVNHFTGEPLHRLEAVPVRGFTGTGWSVQQMTSIPEVTERRVLDSITQPNEHTFS
jgi:hypothetical protein